MTNPAWVVLFTKIAGLVTDTGGTTSHPAVLSREFGIPAVVGTSGATRVIATGDRIRVDGSKGIVEVLERAGAAGAAVGAAATTPAASIGS
jgi:pyruvate,water dikinase